MPRLSAARAAGRRRQIIDAALVCFATRGFHKTTIEDVVEQSGLSAGAIYCHFAGKNDIIRAVVAQRHRRDTALLQKAATEASFSASLGRLAADFVDTLAAPEERRWRRLAVQIWAESLHDRRLLAEVRDGVDRPRSLLGGLIRRAQARGELPRALDPDAAAHLLIACFQGLVLQLTWNPTLDVAACTEALTFLLGGAAGRPAPRTSRRRPPPGEPGSRG
jgi:TetR/AcrR family transcriptional regulator, transcriptional repressor of aconitase